MRFEEILKHQEATLSPTLLEAGLARLVINDAITLHLRKFPGETCFFLYGKLGTLPPSEGPIFTTLLEANLFGQKTGYAYFAYHPPSQTPVLMTIFDEETATPDLFSQRLQEFVSFYSHWATEMESAAPPREKEENLLELMSKKNQRLFFI